MNTQNIFDQLTQEFNLKPTDYYFLDLVPLIEIMWMDGKNQEGELKILYQYVLEHIAYLDQAVGAQVITVEDANDFLERFAHNKPSPELLAELHQFIMQVKGVSESRKINILEYCLDISAACVTQYPYNIRDRIHDYEKVFLLKLFSELDISTQQLAEPQEH